uniref:Uncharacterized protein n=1 Tax=Anguilla anguilla TaxID=7936 RepID=A0A0E9SX62_ANGAN
MSTTVRNALLRTPSQYKKVQRSSGHPVHAS